MFLSNAQMQDCGIIWHMKDQRRAKILLDAGENAKTCRDRCSGFMRHVAERSLPWDIRLFARRDMQERQTWNRLFMNWEPDGIFLNSLDGIRESALRRIPHIVVFGSSDESLNRKFPQRSAFVYIDNEQIAAEAFRLLLRRGLNHFAYVHPSDKEEGIGHSQVRAETFVRMAGESGCDCCECRLDDCGNRDWATTMLALAEELSSLPRPCGIMAYNDRCAREVIDACNYAKLRIPEQIQVVGVDNEEDICEGILPRLTSLVPDFVGAGRLAARMMEDLLASNRPQGSLLCGVLRIAERDTTYDLSGSARLVTAAEKLIHAHACQGLPPSSKGLTVQSLAAALHVSRSLLEMRFSAVMGEGAAAAIRRRKLEEVYRMLRETALPIGEIAARCGFPVQTHLNAVFRRTFGTTLRSYRTAPPEQIV